MDLNAKGLVELAERDLVQTAAKEPSCIALFYKSQFKRCQLLEGHLELLAKKYPGIRFVKIQAEFAPFFVFQILN